jgi:hypothetical protein
VRYKYLQFFDEEIKMNRVRTSLLLMAALVLMFGGVRQVKAVDIITNGSFETGDFTGWGTKDMAGPFYPLEVRVAGTSPFLGFFLSEPTDGFFAATHGFDGRGPDTIELFQDVAIPARHSAILTFDWRAGWYFTLGIPANVRTLDLVIEPAGGGSPLSTTNILTADPVVNMLLLDTGPNSDSVDLSEFAGSSIRINFVSTIPDEFSGPAHLQIDNVVLDVQFLTLSGIAATEIKQVIIQKYEMLETFDEMLEKEWAAYETLQEMLESGDYEDLNKDDIVKARQKIHSAIQHQEQSIDALEQGIEKMIDALSAMGYELILPNVIITYPENGAEFGHIQTIEIEADACDVDGSVVKVEFFANGNKIGEDNDGTDGWKTNWDIHPVGTYDLTARATDNDGAATTSPIVTITLFKSPLPGLAINPNPPDGAIDIAVSTDLSWTAGINAVSHNVYFGTTSPGTFRGNQTAATFDPGIMSFNTTYYWRIDEVNPSGTNTGTVWTFQTRGGGPHPPPPPIPPLPPPP